MPTLSGKLWTIAGGGYTGSFRIVPFAHGTGETTVSGLAITVACGTDGSAGVYSQAILFGDYWVEIPGFPRFLIQVPTTGTYALEEVDVDADSPLSYARVYDDADALGDVTLPSSVEMVTLRVDDDTPASTFVAFYRSTHANVVAYTPDGLNVVADASNNRFVRQGVDPENL